MTTSALRSIAVGVVPVLIGTGAVAGCGTSAPEVQAPPETATSIGAAQSTASSTGVPTVTPTDTGVPTVSSAPATSTGGDPSKVCTTSDDFNTPGVLAPSTKKAPWGKPLDVTQRYEGTVSMTPTAPVAKNAPADDIFGPQHGQVYLLVKVTVAYKSGNDSVFGGTGFTLRDAENNVCDYNSIADIVPERGQFDVVTVGRSKVKNYTGTLVYEVPAGQDYKKYTLLYLPDLYVKNANAPVAWTN